MSRSGQGGKANRVVRAPAGKFAQLQKRQFQKQAARIARGKVHTKQVGKAKRSPGN